MGVQRGVDKEIGWVIAHNETGGNEYADYKAKEAGSIGRLLHQRQRLLGRESDRNSPPIASQNGLRLGTDTH